MESSPAPSILDDKEALYRIQSEMLRQWPVLVQVSLSVPGGFSLYPWETLFAEAKERSRACLTELGADVAADIELLMAFGPVCLMAVKAADGDPAGAAPGGKIVKLRMVELEESAPWRRLWDIDVLTRQGPVDRENLGLPPRRCLVCGKPAHTCRMTGAHDPSETISAARELTRGRGESDAAKRR